MALVKEIRYLFLAHGINVAIPLLLIPLLAHRLGIDGFGHFVILTGSSIYLAYSIELGLNNIAIQRFTQGNHDDRCKVFTSILIIKCVLLAIVFPIGMTIYTRLLHTWGADVRLAWFCMLPVVTCLSYPAWFFIVENKQKVNFQVQTLTKFFLLACICFFVHTPDDVATAVIIYSSAAFLASLAFCGHWLRYIDIRALPDAAQLSGLALAGAKASGLAIRDAWSSNGIAPLLGLIIHTQQIADFALAEKMIRALAVPASSFGSIILANHKKFQDFFATKTSHMRIAIVVLLVAYAVSAVLVSKGAKRFFPQYEHVALLFTAMLISVPFIYANYTLLNLKYIRRQKYIALTGFISLQCMCVFVLTLFFAGQDSWFLAAISMSSVEIVAFFYMLFFSDRRKRRVDSPIDAY